MARIILPMKKDKLRETFTLEIAKERFADFVKLVAAGGKAQGDEVIVEVQEDFV